MMSLTETQLVWRRECHNAARGLRGVASCSLALAILGAAVLGCDSGPPPAADLSKTPWLDPAVQTEGLSHADKRIRGLSALNLGNIGAAAAGAIPQLERLAEQDSDAKVRDLAQQAIEKIRAAVASGE